MNTETPPVVEMIAVDRIAVVNPRVRNKRLFKEIVGNIEEIGLKRPITVTKRQRGGHAQYDLVCGQGRLEAYRRLGQAEIPAIVIDADSEDCLIMSLVENLARRRHQALDLLRDIEGLKQRGYRSSEIAAKTGLTVEYVRGVTHLLENGEQRLLRAVEAGSVPVSVAVEIAEADDTDIQNVLQEAYEQNLLRGNKLIAVKRLVEQRRVQGKRLKNNRAKPARGLSLEALLRTYQEDTNKKRSLVRRAEATRNQLIFIVEALRKLTADEDFLALLQAEGMETMPRNLGDRIHASMGGA